MTADRDKNRIIESWRRQFAELAGRHLALVAADAAGRGGEAAALRRQMRDLERAIKRFLETKQGEFRRLSQGE